MNTPTQFLSNHLHDEEIELYILIDMLNELNDICSCIIIRQHSQLKQVISLYYLQWKKMGTILDADGHTKNRNLKCGDIYLF